MESFCDKEWSSININDTNEKFVEVASSGDKIIHKRCLRLVRRLSVIPCIVISRFCYFSIKFSTDTHLHTHNRSFAQTFSSVSLLRNVPSSINEENLIRFAFHRRKFNFLLKELCQNAVGAVSTCFIYSSAFKRFFLLESFVFNAQIGDLRIRMNTVSCHKLFLF